MLPEDIQDLMIAFVLLVSFVIIGMGFLQAIDKEEFVNEDEELQLRDEESVFFLSLLKTNVEDKTITDLIILSEDDRDLLKVLEKEIRKIVVDYGRRDYEYGLKIKYPNDESGDFEEFGCTSKIEYIGLKQNLPSLNGGLIELYFAFRGAECIPI